MKESYAYYFEAGSSSLELVQLSIRKEYGKCLAARRMEDEEYERDALL
ncbi:hypothetical protein ACFSC6_08575 [Rufibacter sediminis]